jgi:hypothetical protein
MQITVSSEIENRIDDSSSTAERRRGDGVDRRRPSVAVVIGLSETNKAGPKIPPWCQCRLRAGWFPPGA